MGSLQEMIKFTQEDLTRWNYNALDCMYTLEIAQVLENEISKTNTKLQEFHKFQIEKVAPALVDIMNQGVKIDLEKKELLKTQLTELLASTQNTINYIVGEPLNINSPTQLKTLFKDLLKIELKIDKKSKSESCASAYMFQYLNEYPEYKVLLTLILEYRSIGVFLRTFVNAEVDEDGRMRTSYNCAGTKTYRLSSRKNAFGKGANLANIPSKGKIDLKYSLAALESQQDSSDEDEEFISGDYEGIHKLPNCKEFFIPDQGFKFWNADYSGADAMVVAWDSDCQWLQNFFETSDKKLYIYIAENYFQREVTTDDPWYKKFKQFVHLTNYGGMEEKAAASSGMPIKDAKSIKQWYFSTCPEIPDWHKRLASDVKTKGYIENVFGARGWFLNKDCPTILNQAYAWIPQSTIAILVNKGLVNIWENENKEDIATLLQVHDALAGISSLEDKEAEKRIIKHMTIELGYKKPLVIPVDFSYSSKSYGDCK
jgi:DNA polymerase I-like protein with 3'-5' exonuclease and polymerase domains